MTRRNKPAPDFRDLARSIAADSIVTQALARLIEQIVEEIHASEIAPLRRRTAELESALAGMVKNFRPFTSRPVGAPDSAARAEQDAQVAAYDAGHAALQGRDRDG